MTTEDSVPESRDKPRLGMINPAREKVEDLVAFLHGRLDDEERIARAARPVGGGTDLRWKTMQAHCRIPGAGMKPAKPWCVFTDPGETYIADTSETVSAVAEHIACHDPDRVLADVDAKRQRIDWCLVVIGNPRTSGMKIPDFGVDWDEDDCSLAKDLADQMLRLDALPYAAHEGYREEWRPR